jgi:hypothetical protein
MISEKYIEAKLRLGIQSLGGLCIKVPATFFAGLPDRLCILPGGKVFFVETKAPGKKASPVQLAVARKITALGVSVHLVDSVEAVDELVSSYGFSNVEMSVLEALESIRVKIKEEDPSDDLGEEDLAELQRLQAKKHRHANS